MITTTKLFSWHRNILGLWRRLKRNRWAVAAGIGALPALAVLSSLAGTDYLASRLDQYSRYQLDDSEERGQEEDEDALSFRYGEFNPYENQALYGAADEVYPTNDLAQAWPHLDPVVQNRILLRSRYPLARMTTDSDEVMRVLKSSGLDQKYPNSSSSFEIFARAGSKGDHGDIARFVAEYRACFRSKSCEAHDFYEKVASHILEIYTYPSMALITQGQCSRAKYVNAVGLRILDSLDPPIYEADETINQIYMISAMAEQDECMGQFTHLSRALDESDATALYDSATWENRFPALEKYTHALNLYDKGRYVDSYQLLGSIPYKKDSMLSDMSRHMQIRCISSSLKTNEDGGVNIAVAPHNEAKQIIFELATKISRSSLRSDAQEYLDDLNYDSKS